MIARKSHWFRLFPNEYGKFQTEHLQSGTIVVYLTPRDAAAIRAVALKNNSTFLDHLRRQLAVDPDTHLEVDIDPCMTIALGLAR